MFNISHIEYKKFDLYYLIFILFVVLFVPFVPVTNSFNLNVEEILLIYPFLKLIISGDYKWDRFSIILISFAGYIIFTICINGHYLQFNEYFEVFKVLKFLIIFWFASSILYMNKNLNILFNAIDLIFILSFFINMVHYFDFFDFTRNILVYFDPNGIDVKSYGLNSLGQVSSKRLIGTLGNPNENGLFFLFLFLFYSARGGCQLKRFFSMSSLGFIGSAIIVILTQSRTSIVILAVVTLSHLLFNPKRIKEISILVAISIICVLILINVNIVSFSYISNTSASVMQNHSFVGRVDVWKMLLDQWLEKPIFGWGPNKAYMYANHIYPENEYIFFLWRYGIIGLLFYLYLLIQPFLFLGKAALKNEFVVGLFLILSITAITNISIFNMKLLFFVAIGYSYIMSLKNRNRRYVE